MNAEFEQLVDGDLTPILEPGASYNVTVRFSFDEGTNGQLILKVISLQASMTQQSQTMVSALTELDLRIG